MTRAISGFQIKTNCVVTCLLLVVVVEGEEARFLKTKYGNAVLMDPKGYMYVADKKTSKKILWKCWSYKAEKCKARAHTMDFKIVYQNCPHNHDVKPRQNYSAKKYNMDVPVADIVELGKAKRTPKKNPKYID